MSSTEAVRDAPAQGRGVAAGERPELLALCGGAGLFGGLAFVAAEAVARARMPAHDALADTISALGRGPGGWIMDTGFYCQAAGLVGLAIGAAHAHLGRWGWSFGVLALALLGLLTVLIGVWDFFHRGEVPVEDYSVHLWLSYALLPFYLLGPVAMAPGAARVRPLWRPVFFASAAGALVLGPAFVLAPDGWDGLVERLLALAGLVWTLGLAGILMGRAAALGRG